MPKYNFKCPDCSFKEVVDAAIPEYLSVLESAVNYDLCSNQCLYKDKRVFKGISFFETSDGVEALETMKSEARELADRVRSGDLKAIEDICG